MKITDHLKLGALLLAGLAVEAAVAAEVTELSVSPDGLTPHEALLKIRAAKAAGNSGGFVVRVAAGVYPLAEPLVFTPEDSGTPSAPVQWIGAGERSVIAGGMPLTGWKDAGGGVWKTALPRGKNGRPAFFEQLWVNGRRAARARLPDTGYLKTLPDPRQTTFKEGDGEYTISTIRLDTNAVARLAAVPSDELAYAQLGLIQKWSFTRRIVRGVDAAKGEVSTRAPVPWPHYSSWSGNMQVFFENVRSAFDAPGEWFYDAKNAEVCYRPLPGEDMARAEVLAPTSELSQLVVFAGDPERERYVHDISFEGLAFAASASKTIVSEPVRRVNPRYEPPSEGPTESWQYQAAQASDAAITCTGAQRIRWEGCFVRHTANYGFRFNDGCTSNAVVNCTLEDLGAGGVWMGALAGHVPPGQGDALQRREYDTIGPKSVAYNLVSNSTIRAAGRFNPEGTGVAITHASNCRVIHCDIYDILYTGVSVGWVWGWKGSVAQHNEIAYNRIYDLGQGVMSDMGGVYTLGTSFGTRVHHNVIHDVISHTYGGWALYTDEGSEDVVMECNLCWNTTDGGFHQHYGCGNTVRNNIFAWNRHIAAFRLSRARVKDVPCSLNFVGNIVIVDGSPFMAPGSAAVRGVWANNVWWDVQGKATFGGTPWAEWCLQDREWNSVNADPLFVDAKGLDFRLKPGSPAFSRGFKAWNFDEAGRK